MRIRDLKHNAKLSLKGKYLDAMILIIFNILTSYSLIKILNNLYLLIITEHNISIPNNINELIPSIISLFVTSLFYYGQLSYSIQVSRNQQVSFTELFKRTDMWLGFIWITLIASIFICLWSILFIIPGIIAIYNYQMIYYIKVDTPHMSTLETLRYSKDLMHGNKLKFLSLQLSFIGWIIVGIFSLGIGFLWIIPYMQVTFANFYNSIIPDRYDKPYNQINNTNYNIQKEEPKEKQNINQINNNNTPTSKAPSWNVNNLNTTMNNNIGNNNQ